MSSTQDKSLLKNSQIVVSMMKNLGIRECDDQVVNHLLEFNNYRSISLILEEAKSCAIFANKDTVDVNDVQMAIQMAKDVGLPKSPPSKKLVNARNLSNKIHAINPASRLRKSKDESHFSAKNYKLKTRMNTGINAWKNIIEKTAAEILNVAQTRAIDNTDILTQYVQNLDDLPELTDLDVEEVIANQQNNEEVITPKINNFNVDSLLNDPYSL